MSTTTGLFEARMRAARAHGKKGQWQEELQQLQHALSLCSRPNFPYAQQCKQRALHEIGGVQRRLGQYKAGIENSGHALEAYDYEHERHNSIMRSRIYGELGAMHRLDNDFEQAQEDFRTQYDLAFEMSIEADAEMCRAIGNEGMCAYNRSQRSNPPDQEMLRRAIKQLEERVKRAEDLGARLLREKPEHSYVPLSVLWRVIGLDRLSKCHVTLGDNTKGLEYAMQSQAIQRRIAKKDEDLTVRAYSAYFYGNALFANGKEKEAIEIWSTKEGVSTAAQAFCKEPSAEHTGYIRQMAEAGADLEYTDEHGFTALDYANLTDNVDAREMIEIIAQSFRPKLRNALASHTDGPFGPPLQQTQINALVEREIEIRRTQANLQRVYREIMQEQIRPVLMKNSTRSSVQSIREAYAACLDRDETKKTRLDYFWYLAFNDFKKMGRLPRSDEFHPGGSKRGWAKRYTTSPKANDKLHIIFFSYRWIGRDHGMDGPDDAQDSQYNRMLQAVSQYKEQCGGTEDDELLSDDDIGIWLDYACIEQRQMTEKDKGINALPLAVVQCDAVISLVDDFYYTRAWCAVEVTLIRQLGKRSRLHIWWEHLLHDSKNRLDGDLILGRGEDHPHQLLDPSKLVLSNRSDWPQVKFLFDQSKLLG